MGLGRLDRALRQTTERLRIAGLEAAEAVDRQRIAIEIARPRRRALLAFFIIAASVAVPLLSGSLPIALSRLGRYKGRDRRPVSRPVLAPAN